MTTKRLPELLIKIPVRKPDPDPNYSWYKDSHKQNLYITPLVKLTPQEEQELINIEILRKQNEHEKQKNLKKEQLKVNKNSVVTPLLFEDDVVELDVVNFVVF